MKTEEKIINKALQLFNEKGIEYVGMRELAAELGMRIGNITYYFPTKADIVYRISVDLSELNLKVITQSDQSSIEGFLAMMEGIFRNQVRYRCILLSFVHLIAQNNKVAEGYKYTEAARNETWRERLKILNKNGYLIDLTLEEMDFLVSQIALIGRFWLSEATVSHRHWPVQKQIAHYLKMLARGLLPYSSQKGKSELEAYLNHRIF